MLTITLINLGLGVLTSLWLMVNGVDNVLLWGLAVALFNFAPYIGAVASILLLSVVGLLQFDVNSEVLVLIAGYLVLTVIEGQLLTPLLVGHSLEISPYVIFLCIILLGWMWGLAGVLMAVPILVSLKIIGSELPQARSLESIIAIEHSDSEQAVKEV